jgi:hypothetical protein
LKEEQLTENLIENRVYTDLTKSLTSSNNYLGYRNNRQTIFCSATIPQRKHFVQLCYKNEWTQRLAELVHITPEEIIPKQIVHEYIECEAVQRIQVIKYLIQYELNKNKDKKNSLFQAIIFVDTFDDIDNLYEKLSQVLSPIYQILNRSMHQSNQSFTENNDDFNKKETESLEKESLLLKKIRSMVSNKRLKYESKKVLKATSISEPFYKIDDNVETLQETGENLVARLDERMSIDERSKVLDSYRLDTISKNS